jgi:hypothetical protein
MKKYFLTTFLLLALASNSEASSNSKGDKSLRGADGGGGGHTIVLTDGTTMSLDDYKTQNLTEESVCRNIVPIDLNDQDFKNAVENVNQVFEGLVITKVYFRGAGLFKKGIKTSREYDFGEIFKRRVKQLNWKYCMDEMPIIYDMGLQSSVDGKVVQGAIQFSSGTVLVAKNYFGKNIKHDEALVLHELLESFFGIEMDRKQLRALSAELRRAKGSPQKDKVKEILKELGMHLITPDESTDSAILIESDNNLMDVYNSKSYKKNNGGFKGWQITQYVRDPSGNVIKNSIPVNKSGWISKNIFSGAYGVFTTAKGLAYDSVGIPFVNDPSSNVYGYGDHSFDLYFKGYRLEKICLESVKFEKLTSEMLSSLQQDSWTLSQNRLKNNQPIYNFALKDRVIVEGLDSTGRASGHVAVNKCFNVY